MEPEKIVAAIANTNINIVAATGEEVFGDTFLKVELKKKALSLAIAYISLEPEVIETVPQAKMDIITTTKNIFPTTEPRFV